MGGGKGFVVEGDPEEKLNARGEVLEKAEGGEGKALGGVVEPE